MANMELQAPDRERRKKKNEKKKGKERQGSFIHSGHEGHTLLSHLNCAQGIQTVAERRRQSAQANSSIVKQISFGPKVFAYLIL